MNPDSGDGQSPPQRPSVGRAVHYVSHGTPVREDGTQAYTAQCRAAVVTAVDPAPDAGPGDVFVSLAVLNPTGLFFDQFVLQDEDDHAGGTWHFPERV
ncbi:hypothetical protein ACFV16_22095 [Streptomyces massasporeus]|uniref:hypothetical protein n=1 Tax=Streptomyces massasporeus TaxID=67324 RepID=UPI0036AE6CD0